MAIIYYVYDDNPETDGCSYFHNLRDAKVHARNCAKDNRGQEFEVIRCETVKLPLKELLVLCLENRGWAASHKPIYKIGFKGKGDDG